MNLLLNVGVTHLYHSRLNDILLQMPSFNITEEKWHHLKEAIKQTGFEALAFDKLNNRKKEIFEISKKKVVQEKEKKYFF